MDVDYKYPEVDIIDTEKWNVDYSKDKEEEEEEDKYIKQANDTDLLDICRWETQFFIIVAHSSSSEKKSW